MVKILHMADAHLDSPLSSLPKNSSAVMRHGLLSAFTKAIQYARMAEIDLVLIAGDLFDGEYVSSSTLASVIRAFEESPGIRFFISPGNHDPISKNSPYTYASFPSNVHVFRSSEIERVDIDELGVSVYGKAATRMADTLPCIRGFSAADSGRINIGVFHGLLTGAKGDEYAPISEQDLILSGLDYAALGHVHSTAGVKKSGETYHAYPGCIQGRGFDETGRKGFLAGTVEKGSVSLEFVDITVREVVVRRVSIEGAREIEEIISRIENMVEKIDPSSILRLELVGTVPADLSVETEVIKAALGEYFHLEVLNRTKVRVDIDELARQNTLQGFFVKNIKLEMMGAEDPAEKELLERALYAGLTALEGEKVNVDDN